LNVLSEAKLDVIKYLLMNLLVTLLNNGTITRKEYDDIYKDNRRGYKNKMKTQTPVEEYAELTAQIKELEDKKTALNLKIVEEMNNEGVFQQRNRFWGTAACLA